MNCRSRFSLGLGVVCLLAVFARAGAPPRALADGPGAGGDYALESSVLDAGVGVMSSDQFVLQGSFGQPTANGLFLSGDQQLGLGFWSTLPFFQTWLPIVLRP